VKDYQTVCADLIMMLMDLEASLDDITETAKLVAQKSAQNQVSVEQALPTFSLTEHSD
jgi:hypothetical protein